MNVEGDMDSRFRGNDGLVADCTAVILAGGESRRMGKDKAQVEFQGETLLNRAIANLRPLFGEIVLSVRSPLPVDFPQVIDVGEGRGPMTGLAAALESVRTDWLFAIGVDMPFVVPELVQHMAEQRSGHDAVLAEISGCVQPMPAFYAKKTCLPAMQTRIKQGRRSLIRLIPSLNTVLLTEYDLHLFDPDLRSFTDFDTPEDLMHGESASLKSHLQDS